MRAVLGCRRSKRHMAARSVCCRVGHLHFFIPAGSGAQPLSLEELLQRRQAEQEAQAKPVFLTKEQRARLALEKRAEEAAAARQRLAEMRQGLAAAGHGPAGVNGSSSAPPGDARDRCVLFCASAVHVSSSIRMRTRAPLCWCQGWAMPCRGHDRRSDRRDDRQALDRRDRDRRGGDGRRDARDARDDRTKEVGCWTLCSRPPTPARHDA